MESDLSGLTREAETYWQRRKASLKQDVLDASEVLSALTAVRAVQRLWGLFHPLQVA